MIRAVVDMSVWDTGAMQEAVGAAIRTRREARGWKQEELGAHAHVDKGTVSRIERGTNTSVDTLLRLTRALDVELEITLRDPQGHTQTVRDVLPTVTPTVAVPSEPTVAPGEVSPLSSLPSSPSHVALYGIIGELLESLPPLGAEAVRLTTAAPRRRRPDSGSHQTVAVSRKRRRSRFASHHH